MLLLPFDFETDPYIVFNFTAENPDLHERSLSGYDIFHYVFWRMQKSKIQIGVGGYNECRIFYQNNQQFGFINKEHCDVHLGIDIWIDAGTPVYVPVDGIIHSWYADKHFRSVYDPLNVPADYGPTIILEHNTDSFPRYSLYGHLSRRSIFDLYEGKIVKAGDRLAETGGFEENRGWHPHLHFQLMHDLMGFRGIFPEVCRPSERSVWLANCPDPNQWLGIRNT